MTEVIPGLTEALADRYTIQRELGRGGMAVVYLAHDHRLGRDVALKVLRPELTASIGANRFVREIEIAAQLSHPNILGLHDCGGAPHCLYFTMPYVDGESLRQRLNRERQLPIDEALRITREVADALTCAHEHGVIHRDIKPENILLHSGHAVVTDFGVARALSEAGREALTATGLAVGTPAYMSPEQAAGVPTTDGRTDIYSLACVVYEMLSGETPYVGATPQAILAKKLSEPIPNVATLRETVSPSISRALAAGLAKSPADRPSTVREFVALLERGEPDVEEHRAEQARRKGWGAVARTFVSAIMRGSRTALLGLAGVVAAAATAAWLGSRGVGALLAPNRAPLDTTRYAVLFVTPEGVGLPFDPEQLMQDALTRWNGLTVANPVEVREALLDRGGSSLRIADAAAIAREVEAGRLVFGDVRAMADSARVRVSLLDARTGTPLYSGSAVVSSSSTPAFRIFAALADTLLLRGTAPGAPSAATTRSLPARQAFASGHRALASWDLERADAAFASATTFDPSFAQAFLWSAIVRWWRGAEPANWLVAAEQAHLGVERMNEADGAMLAAMLALKAGDIGQACEHWRSRTEQAPHDYAGWYGLAQCRRNDDAVVPDSARVSGWRFRASYASAWSAYRRAFELHPAILVSFRSGAYESLQDLFMTSGIWRRAGRALRPDTTTFMADPSWEGGELVLVPYPAEHVRSHGYAAPPADQNRAVQAQRELFRDVALAWVGSAPESGDALEALAIAMALLGDPAALDTLRRAQARAEGGSARSRMAIEEAQMLFAFSLPWHLEGLRRTRRLADSLLSRSEAEATDDRWFLAGVAALTGRASLAARLARDPRAAAAIGTPPTLRQTAPALLVFASFGGPPDTLRLLERRVRAAIGDGLLPPQRESAFAQWLARPASLAYPTHVFDSMEELARRDELVALQSAMSTGDTLRVRRGLARSRAVKQEFHPATLTPDALYPEAELYVLLGAPDSAATHIDPTLRALARMAPGLIGSPVHAAALMRMAALRARVAEQLADLDEAKRWAEAVTILWSGADEFLQPLVADMQRIMRRRGSGSDG